MAITNAKHNVAELNGVRCTVVESGISVERAAFLRRLLEYNNFEIQEVALPVENENEETKYTIGVTDLLFNPVFSIYECLLGAPEGGYVTPGYWNQECIDCDPRYWMRRRKR